MTTPLIPQGPTRVRHANLVAVTPGGAITDDMILGDYFWFNVPGEMKAASTVRHNWRDAGLDLDLLPKARTPYHVAMEAIRQVEGDRSNGRRRRVTVGEVSHTNESLVYQVTLQVWPEDEAVIDYEKSMRVTFDKATGEFASFEPLDPEAYSQLRHLEDAIKDHYAKHRSWFPGDKLRTIIRHMLEDAGAENMSDSGKSAVYYITHDKEDLLKSVRTFLNSTYKGTRTHTRGNLHYTSVINDEGQREMLKRKFIENCDEDVRAYRDRLLDLVKRSVETGKGFRSDLVHNLKEERNAINERRARFEAVLNDELSELDQSMGLADRALTKLLQEAEV